MYRNLYYNNTKGLVTEWSWNEDGERVERKTPFKPFLYVETNDPAYDAISIFETKLKKLEFKTDWDRRKFEDKTTKRLFFNIPVKQQYLLDRYLNTSMDEMTQHPLRTFYLDIEVYSPDTFPEAEFADFPINVITIYNTEVNKFYTWGLESDYDYSGLEDIDISKEDVIYVSCSDEKNLLECFINYWSKNYPDLITGWNSATFDIPYIINRITKLLGIGSAKRLSPVNNLYKRVRSDAFENYYDHWVIDGVSDIDYLELYKKSESNDKETHRLDYIANLEGVDGKVAFESANLADLADDDWNKFVTYNIQDVNIMVKLEYKKNYLKIARAKSYRGFATMDKALDSVPIVTGMIAKSALDQNQIIVTYKNAISDTFPGGYVFKPTGKLHRGIVSFDVNSLYPNTMITLNTSPETKVGKVVKLKDDLYNLQLVSGKSKRISHSTLLAVIEKNDLVLTKANVLFSQKKRGICAKFLDDMYNERKHIKSLMEKTDDPDLKAKYDIEQYLLKILLNSVYGVFGNKFFGMYDIDIAESVTKTGSEMIKKSTEIVQNYAKKVANVDENIVVYGDTDSNFFDFGKILSNLNVEFFETKEDGNLRVTNNALKVIDDFENRLNKEINQWAEDELYTKDSRYHFTREKICFMGTFLTKKNYILRVLNNEGEECDKIMEKGVELVKSSHSDSVKNIIRTVTNCIFYEKGKLEANSNYIKALEAFKKLPPEDVAKRQNAKDHDNHVRNMTDDKLGFAKGTPMHHKASIFYNFLLDEMGLNGKYPKIKSGNKVKTVYIQKNKYGTNAIAFIDKLPEEFDIHIDYDTQFKKMIMPLILRCYKGSDWKLPNINKIPKFNLFEFLELDD